MKYFFSLLLFLIFQPLFAQKNTHRFSLLGGLSISTKFTRLDSYVPLTFEYEFRHGKHGFSTGFQGERGVSNWKTNFESVSEFEKYCKDWYCNKTE
jgi:hypothetical protein